MIPIRFYIFAGIAALLGYLLWREHSLVRRLNDANHATAQAVADLTAERAARAHEQAINKLASDDYENRLKALDDGKAATPVRSVRLCHSSSASVPGTTAAASGIDAANTGGLPVATGSDLEEGPDIGSELYALADEMNEHAAACNGLHLWVRSR